MNSSPSDLPMPPLPEPVSYATTGKPPAEPYPRYSGQQMRAYARAYAAQVTVGYVLVPKYKTAMGLAAEKYLYSVNRFAHPLPQQFLWEKCFEMMIAAAQPPPGYVLVPIEPTPEMLAAGVAAESNAATHVQERLTLYAYRAMIAAAQEKP